jgi:hypothetical protein
MKTKNIILMMCTVGSMWANDHRDNHYLTYGTPLKSFAQFDNNLSLTASYCSIESSYSSYEFINQLRAIEDGEPYQYKILEKPKTPTLNTYIWDTWKGEVPAPDLRGCGQQPHKPSSSTDTKESTKWYQCCINWPYS